MSSKDLIIITPPSPALPIFPLGKEQYLELAGEWFGLDVGNGDARLNTIETYKTMLRHWLEWCVKTKVDPARATVENVKQYRRKMVEANLSRETISLKLTAIRQFYECAKHRGAIEINPAKFIKPAKERSAKKEQLLHLETDEANHLFQIIPRDGRPKSVRDKAMIALMTIAGLRRSEVVLANLGDIAYVGGKKNPRMELLVHGKGKDRYKYLRADAARALENWLKVRATLPREAGSDEEKSPIFVALTKGGKPGGRITLDGVSKMVNEYFVAAGLRARTAEKKKRRVAGEIREKKPRPEANTLQPRKPRQRSCHALRHTFGTELWRAHADLKVVQEELGHTTVAMAARYSHVDAKSKAKYSDDIEIEID